MLHQFGSSWWLVAEKPNDDDDDDYSDYMSGDNDKNYHCSSPPSKRIKLSKLNLKNNCLLIDGFSQ